MTGHEKRCKHLTSEDREEIQTGLNVAVAHKQNLRHRSIRPPNGTFCRDLRSGKIVHFCRKSGLTQQIAANRGNGW